MAKGITISVEDAIIFELLLIETRDSVRLQEITDCGYIGSINKLNKLRKKLGR